MSKETSGFTNLDVLNTTAAFNSGGQSPVRQPSRFASALSSINQFLQTATDTIVTVDGVINKREESHYQQNGSQLPTAQHASGVQQIPAPLKYLAVAGLALGGSVLAYKSFT